MKLHQLGWQRDLGRNMAPLLSKSFHSLGATQFLRKLIAYLNYLLGRGAGTSSHLDAEIAAALQNVHRAKPVIFDVGANVGSWSESFIKLNGNASLYLFEPQPACQDRIRSLNLPGTRLMPMAVGSEPGRFNLYSSDEFDGAASLSERQDSYFQDRKYTPIAVDVIRLDDFIREERFDFIDFIKFDIEGHEFHALKGLKNSIERKSIGAFSFEFGSGNLNSRTCFRDFWNLISDQYHIFIITPGGSQEEIHEYYEDLEYYRGVSNYIAVLKNHPFANPTSGVQA